MSGPLDDYLRLVGRLVPAAGREARLAELRARIAARLSAPPPPSADILPFERPVR